MLKTAYNNTMDTKARIESTGMRLLMLLGAAAGTFLLIFVPGGRWLTVADTPVRTLLLAILKHVLTGLGLLIVPSLWARLIHRTSPLTAVALTAFAFGCGWLVSRDATDALYLTLMVALPGVGLWGLQKLGLNNFRTVLYESFLTLGGLYALVCLGDLIRTGDAYVTFRQLIDLYGQALNAAGLLETQISGFSVQEMITVYQMNTESICVPLLLAFGMFAGLSNTLFSHLWNRNGGVTLPKLKRFPEWRCERWYVLFVAVFSIAMMLLSLTGIQAANALSSVADVMWRLPCSLAGLCAVRRLALRAGRGWAFWLICAATLLLPTIAGLLLTMLGMLSSLRKSIDVGEDGRRK